MTQTSCKLAVFNKLDCNDPNIFFLTPFGKTMTEKNIW